jgi:hypothetical protein
MSTPEMRKRLAALSFSEKIKILEKTPRSRSRNPRQPDEVVSGEGTTKGGLPPQLVVRDEPAHRNDKHDGQVGKGAEAENPPEARD